MQRMLRGGRIGRRRADKQGKWGRRSETGGDEREKKGGR